MIAAIYARKSTDQSGVSDEQKSVARQVEHATAYAEQHGWMVVAEHIHVDDGISGAEFANRPGFLRLMNALKPKAPFDVLIMSEESRLGREAIETAYALKQLIQAGVRVFFYLEDHERTLDSPTDKLLMSVTAFADELEREKARQRTYDAMRRKAKAGHVTGGRVFGYDNHEVTVTGADGQPRRSHVERRVNPEEAVVVRRIFDLCAKGRGIRSIAKTLNAEGVTAPRAQQGRPRAWAPSSVREVLYRDTYRGVVVWNKTKKRNAWGQHQPKDRPASDWIATKVPDLRIVTDAAWKAAHDRLASARGVYLRGSNGHLWGRPASGLESKYLLTGLSRCGSCGGTMTVRSRSHGKRRAYFYACSSFHHRGRAVCANSLLLPLASGDDAVLDALEEQLLEPTIIEAAIAQAIQRADRAPQDAEATRAALRATQTRLDAEVGNLTAAVAIGGNLKGLVAALREREADRTRTQDALDALDRPIVQARSAAESRAVIRKKLDDWRGLLRDHAPKARQLVRKLIQGRIIFQPNPAAKTYTFEATGTISGFLAGIVCPQGVASPPGIEPGSRP